MGFAQALSNVDGTASTRGTTPSGTCLGVHGLSSPLLTQMRYQHEAILHTT